MTKDYYLLRSTLRFYMAKSKDARATGIDLLEDWWKTFEKLQLLDIDDFILTKDDAFLLRTISQQQEALLAAMAEYCGCEDRKETRHLMEKYVCDVIDEKRCEAAVAYEEI